MKEVYKYKLELGENYLYIPVDSKILSAGFQGGEEFSLWILVDPKEERTEPRKFFVVGTGHPIPCKTEDLLYINTVLVRQGLFVWHIFECIEELYG